MEMITHTQKVILIVGMLGFIFGMKIVTQRSLAVATDGKVFMRSSKGLNIVSILLSLVVTYKILVY